MNTDFEIYLSNRVTELRLIIEKFKRRFNVSCIICFDSPCTCEEKLRRKQFMDDYLDRNNVPRDYTLPEEGEDYHD